MAKERLKLAYKGQIPLPQELEAYEERVKQVFAGTVGLDKALQAYESAKRTRTVLYSSNGFDHTLVSHDAYESGIAHILELLPPDAAEIFKDLLHRLEKSTPVIPWRKG